MSDQPKSAMTVAVENAVRLIDGDCPGSARDVLKAALSRPEKTKEVSIWRIEYAERHHVTGSWLPQQDTWPTEGFIRVMEERLQERPDVACIKVTGPHAQEVPDDGSQ